MSSCATEAPAFATEVPALLLRLDRNPFHHGTLGAARSLGRAGIEVHAALAPAAGPAGRSRHLRRLYPAPSGPCPAGEIEAVLLRVSDAIGRRAVLVTLDDRSAVAAAALAGRLADRYLLPPVAPGLPARLADKAELAAICREHGVPHPPTALPDSAREAARAADALGLPAVAKWSRPWLLPADLRGTTLVRTRQEAARLFEQSARAGSRLLLQRRLTGGHGTDWFCHGYAAEGGALLAGGTGRKDRSWPPRTGLTAVGSWVPNPPVRAAAARLAERVGYRGVLDLDFRLDPATGTYHLLDFNPRPGAQFRLFTDEAGLDVVRAQHLHLTGRPVPAARGGPGRVFVAENYALLARAAALASPPARQRPPGRLSGPTADGARVPRAPRPGPGGRVPGPPAGAGARPARGGPVERAWFAAEDPAPFLAMGAAWSGRGLRKLWDRFRSVLAAPPGGRTAPRRPLTRQGRVRRAPAAGDSGRPAPGPARLP